jgi:AcrR family transcriptional regulator
MSTNPKDLRVRRTQKWLQEAMLQLLHTKAFRDIQITEITERAEVSRPTFYLHYRTKEELLLSLVDQVFNELYNDLLTNSSQGTYSKLGLCTQLFKTWERHEEKLLLIIRAEIHHEITSRLRDYLRKMLLFIQTQTGKPTAKGDTLDLMVSFMVGGTYALLLEWSSKKLPFNAEQMGLFLHELTISHEDTTIL